MEHDLLSTEIVEQGVADSGPYAGYQSFHVRVRRRMPNFLNSVNLNHVRLGYHYLVNHKIYLLTAPVLAISLIIGAACITTSATPPDDPWSMYGVAKLAFLSGVLFLTTFIYVDLDPRPTYLVDFITRSEFVELAKKSGQFNAEAIEFQHRLLGNSGIGDESYMPRTVFSPGKRIILQEGREEAAMVMFGAVDHLLATTKIKAKDIKILVVNCGVLNTTPSLSAMIINHYKLGGDINSYNLGGMGCAAGAIAVDLARDLLSSHTASAALSLGAHALVVSTEIVSSTWYGGSDLDMLMPNCYFRMGAAALLLSNKHLDRWRAKYELKQVVRTHKGGSMDDRSFRCVELAEDRQGKMGLRFLQDKHRLFEIGGQALKANVTTLGPLVLPVWEQLLFFKSLVFGNSKLKGGPYIPDYKLAFEHVCIQASSKMVLDEVQRNLELTEEYMEASRRTLERFGNTSSSSVWYELAFLEAHGKVKRGDRIWQVALGSGCKCTSMVWEALRKAKTGSNTNPWI